MNSSTGTVEGTLIEQLDRCSTPFGEWLQLLLLMARWESAESERIKNRKGWLRLYFHVMNCKLFDCSIFHWLSIVKEHANVPEMYYIELWIRVSSPYSILFGWVIWLEGGQENWNRSDMKFGISVDCPFLVLFSNVVISNNATISSLFFAEQSHLRTCIELCSPCFLITFRKRIQQRNVVVNTSLDYL